MTGNQISYYVATETERHNKATEGEMNRHQSQMESLQAEQNSISKEYNRIVEDYNTKMAQLKSDEQRLKYFIEGANLFGAATQDQVNAWRALTLGDKISTKISYSQVKSDIKQAQADMYKTDSIYATRLNTNSHMILTEQTKHNQIMEDIGYLQLGLDQIRNNYAQIRDYEEAVSAYNKARLAAAQAKTEEETLDFKKRMAEADAKAKEWEANHPVLTRIIGGVFNQPLRQAGSAGETALDTYETVQRTKSNPVNRANKVFKKMPK